MSLDIQRYIPRNAEVAVLESLETFPVTALLGPRQCGKSTLAKYLLDSRSETTYLDLQKPSDLRKLEDPEFFFHVSQEKLVCIDEIQIIPELFPILRSAVDQFRKPGRFFILGAASQDIVRGSSETLAGRIHYIELSPFSLQEIIKEGNSAGMTERDLWVRGGFPDSLLAANSRHSMIWREDFIRTFLERDIPQFGFSVPALTMRRFWTMLAHYHGQLLNSAKLAQALGVSNPTIRKYLDILAQTYMLRILPPYTANTKKRLIKSPKVYIRDCGILHGLLEIDGIEDLMGHPVIGASWEGFCIELIISMLPRWRPSFYRTSSGEEIDLILERGRRKICFEFKSSQSPKLSRGFRDTISMLLPERTYVVAPVIDPYDVMTNVTVCNPSYLMSALGECTES